MRAFSRGGINKYAARCNSRNVWSPSRTFTFEIVTSRSTRVDLNTEHDDCGNLIHKYTSTVWFITRSLETVSLSLAVLITTRRAKYDCIENSKFIHSSVEESSVAECEFKMDSRVFLREIAALVASRNAFHFRVRCTESFRRSLHKLCRVLAGRTIAGCFVPLRFQLVLASIQLSANDWKTWWNRTLGNIRAAARAIPDRITMCRRVMRSTTLAYDILGLGIGLCN